MSAIDVKEIVYHCQCRRYATGSPVAPCTCPECGREHTPDENNLMSGSVTFGVQPEVA